MKRLYKVLCIGCLLLSSTGCTFGLKLASNDTKTSKSSKSDIKMTYVDEQDDVQDLTVDEVVRAPKQYDGKLIAVHGIVGKPNKSTGYQNLKYIIYDYDTGNRYIKLKGQDIDTGTDKVVVYGVYKKKTNTLQIKGYSLESNSSVNQ